MTEAIIRNHNSRIAFGDTMVHVGDFCCRGKERGDPGMRTHAEQYASRLSGTVVFVRGNHDDNNGLKHAFDTLTFKAGGFNFFVRHKPVHMIGEVPYDCTVMLCGHVHEKWKSMVLEDEERRVLMINVGIDVWNFHPIRLDEVIGFACKRFREIDIERA
jgi:calcineurin-like phosphoesterase family protein